MESAGNTITRILDASSSSNLADPTPHIYIGTPQDTLGYDSVYTLLTASTQGTLSTQFSIDGYDWDVSLNRAYPGLESPGSPLFLTDPIQARFVRTVFTNLSDVPNAIRIQTVLHMSSALAPVAKDTSFGPVPMPVIFDRPVPVTVDTPLDINIFSQDAPVSVSANILNRVDVNLAQQSTQLNVSAQVLNEVGVNILSQARPLDVCAVILGQPINVTLPAATNVWDSIDVGTPALIPNSNGATLFTVACNNFAPDYRFIKIYDSSGPIDINRAIPILIVPAATDRLIERTFPTGLQFHNSIYISATRCVYANDPNMAQFGDIHVHLSWGGAS